LLLEDVASLDDPARFVARAGLDATRFQRCLAEGEAGGEVDRDEALAASIGVGRAATVFVNGLYLSGLPDLERIEATVRDELRRLGRREEPLDDRRDTASSEETSAGASAPVPDVYFQNPDRVITLSRIVVDQAFEDRPALEAALEASRSTYDDQRLLKMRRIEPDDLFDRMGLEAGDVVFAVDGDFVTAERNVFFEALERGGIVRVVLMRRGRPVRIEIRIGTEAEVSH
jgi:sulfur carrier protein ThiS